MALVGINRKSAVDLDRALPLTWVVVWRASAFDWTGRPVASYPPRNGRHPGNDYVEL